MAETPSSLLAQSLAREIAMVVGTKRDAPSAASTATVAAVLTSFNKIEDVRRNLTGIRAQTVPFDRIVVVDNASGDGTPEMIRREFPEVDLHVMPSSDYGACETFNIGFRRAATDYVAILDDDVVLGPKWLEMMIERMRREPPTTALLSSKVVEPGMPDWFKNHPDVVSERYMSTFRGCASLARYDALESCGFYDERFFIYGNERDLTARFLGSGHRVLQVPSVVVDHGTPFGMKASARSLFFHMRNLWWTLFKHCSVWDIMGFIAGQAAGLFRGGGRDMKSDAVGTIGFFTVIRTTPRGLWVVVKATLAALAGLPRYMMERKVCRAVDFSLPTR